MVKQDGAAIQAAARALRAAPRVPVTTGAGMSQDSGIPTFRDAAGGLGARDDPGGLAPQAAVRRPPPAGVGGEGGRRPRCGAPVRPDVVWFGEMLPEQVTAEAWALAVSCRALLVVGTSGLVQPAAQLPLIAREAGATVIEVNPDPTELSDAAHIVCRGRAGAVLPALVAALTQGATQ